MSHLSNDQGRAYEYICLRTLEEEIGKFRCAVIEKNSSYYAAEHAWNVMDEGMQQTLKQSAGAAVSMILILEPLILDGSDVLDLRIQPDTKGEGGDVRDILITRQVIGWEIGLSLKHNHFAVKHSRLAKDLDFGQKWFGVPCSPAYWNQIKPIFDYLEQEKRNGAKWRDLPSKMQDVYIPLLQAFMEEIRRSYQSNPDIPKKMVEYLLGQYDFYKVISLDSKKITQIQPYNLHGTLNRSSARVPTIKLPTRILALDFKPRSKTTVLLTMDGGWRFSFRIHNASTLVETSLKFDVQIVEMPEMVSEIDCKWR